MEVLHTLCLLPNPNQQRPVKGLFPANNSISPGSQMHAPGTFITISFCCGTKLREPHFQVSVMPHCCVPQECSGRPLSYRLFLPLTVPPGVHANAFIFRAEQEHTCMPTCAHTHTMQKYRPDIKYRSYLPDCQAEERLGQAHRPTISNVLK